MTQTTFAVRAVAGAVLVLAAMSQAQAATGSVFGRVGLGSTAGGIRLAAGDLVINVAGTPSYDDQDAPGNTVVTYNVAPNALVDGVSWNLTLSTVVSSWLSEASILFTNSAGDGVVFAAGDGDDFSGTGTYAGSALLSDFGLAFNVLADGKFTVQYFESFDDVAGSADATWTAGDITFAGIGAVPEPASYGLMALGLLGVAGATRRRKAG